MEVNKNTEQPKTVNRVEFLKEQFLSDYRKAIKKNKFLKITDREFSSFVLKVDSDLGKKVIASLGNISKIADTLSEEMLHIDPAFYAFKVAMGQAEERQGGKPEQPYDMVFNFFLENDPTPHKEYLNWYLNLYRDLIRRRKPFSQVSEKVLEKVHMQDGTYTDFLMGGVDNRFFEDLGKVRESLERFDFLKKTKTLREVDKDINRYQTYDQLIKKVRPFMAAEEGSNNVDTLDHKELKAIENQVEYERGDKNTKTALEKEARAKLEYQDDNWVIVWTINKPANVSFGKYSTWCTAGTKYGNMFDHYDKDGKLFVLVKKGYGSKRSIDNDPLVRLQFHFQSNQYMDALDKPIKIAQFLDENPEVKEYFKEYIVRHVLPKKGTKITDHIKLLSDLGYGEQIIQIYKDVQPPSIDLSGFKMKPQFLEELGEIGSLEKLNLSDCNLTELPKSLLKLKKLKYLNCSANPQLKEIPSWFKQMTHLTDIFFTNCDIRNEVDFNGMQNVQHIALDFNPNLDKFPVGVSSCKKLKRLTMSNCNLLSVGDEVLGCETLYMLDLHYNKGLMSIPLATTRIPGLQVVCIDDTSVSNDDIQYLIKNKLSTVDVIQYGKN